MKRYVAFGFFAVALIAAPGCGGGNDPDSLMKQMISQTNDLASAIEKKESADKIKAAADKVKATSDKLDALKLSAEDKKKFEEKYKKEMMDALGNLLKASMSNPEGAKALEGLKMGGGGGGGSGDDKKGP